MPSLSSTLPPELLGLIHQQLMDGAASSPAKEALPVRPPAAVHPQPDPIRQAAVARQNFAAVSRSFRDIDRANLARSENSAVGAEVTRATISSLARFSASQFRDGVSALLDLNPHVGVDFSRLSAEQSAAVLDVLDGEKTGPLHEVSIRAGLDPDPESEALMSRIDRTIARMRDTRPNGKHAKFAFDCFSADVAYARTPDFRQWTNLTSVTLLKCLGLTRALDFSANPGLTKVRLVGCFDLAITPDFSSNRKLTEVQLSGCPSLTVAPDFSCNPALTEVVLAWCVRLTAAPAFSSNPELRKVDFHGCASLTVMPDFSSNPKLRDTDFFNCVGLLTQPDAASNPYLAAAVGQMQRQLANPPFLPPPGR